MVQKKIAVLLLAFNRADLVHESMKAIQKYKPERLYLACDGARSHIFNEVQAVQQTRHTMLSMVNWHCIVKTQFLEHNLGCANAVNDAISWFFKNEEYGIVIEDDVIVCQDFFKMCEILLPKFKNEEKIMHINAQYYGPFIKDTNEVVYGANMYCWGWASWARAWKKMDMQMSNWSSYKFSSMLKTYGWFRSCFYVYYWTRAYKSIKRGTNNSWATRWNFSVLSNNGICISPKVNLSLNIGMNCGTHYFSQDINPYLGQRIGQLKFPLIIPESIEYNHYQLLIDRKEFRRLRYIGMKNKIRRFLNHFL